jgi:hypothetical protein
MRQQGTFFRHSETQNTSQQQPQLNLHVYPLLYKNQTSSLLEWLNDILKETLILMNLINI